MNNLPTSSNLPIARLSAIFEKTTNSYKLYWFYSILQLIKYSNKRQFTLDEITIQLIASSWHPIVFFKISFGKQDQIEQLIKKIKSRLLIDDNAQINEIKQRIVNFDEKDKMMSQTFKIIQRYVPYRLLSAFYKKELRGVKDSEKNKMIIDLANQSFKNPNLSTALYRFVDADSIEINPVWQDYLTKNIMILEGFCLYHLMNYLQSRNPNLPNIGQKILAPPTNRDLSLAKKFWSNILVKQPLNCIFSNKTIAVQDYSIDHFLPWSFVAHDMLWNLSPTLKEVNSSKSNNIPDLKKYFRNFAAVQYTAFHCMFDQKKRKFLEDYCLLFNCRAEEIKNMEKHTFHKKLSDHVLPLSQIAENAGFHGNWIYNTGSS